MTAVDERPVSQGSLHPAPWPVYEPEAVERCAALLADGRSYDYGRGPEVAALEDAFAALHSRTYALAVNSGTSALFVAYQALGVRAGDEVVVPTFTFPATATPLLWLGARPVLADSGEATGNVTASSIEAVLTERTRGIAVTHLYGNPCAMAEIRALADERGLFLVEDCSHAHGAHDNGRRVGTWGDAAVFSVGARKPVSGGHGGVLLTDRQHVFESACLASASQRRSDVSVRDVAHRARIDTGLGGNLRMGPVAAVLAASHLTSLDTLVARKRDNCDRLVAALCELPGLEPVPTRAGCDAGGRFGVHVRYDAGRTGVSRDRMVRRLQDLGLKVGGAQTTPLHRTSLVQDEVVLAPDGYPVADRLSSTWVSLPADYLHGDARSVTRHYVEQFAKAWS